MFSAQDENNPCLTKSGELLHRNTNLRSCACSAAPLRGIVYVTKQQPGATDSSDRPALNNPDWSSVLVTPEMAQAGADALREYSFGEDLREVVTDVFYAMQAEAHGEARLAASVKSER